MFEKWHWIRTNKSWITAPLSVPKLHFYITLKPQSKYFPNVCLAGRKCFNKNVVSKLPAIIRGKEVTSRPRRSRRQGTNAPKGPALQLLTPSLLTSSSLKVEYVCMDQVISGKNSDQQELVGHHEAIVFYWPQHDWNSLSVLTLGRILGVGKVKKFSLWSHYSKDKLSTTQQHLSILQDSVSDYSETNTCLCGLSFHPVYTLGSRPSMSLIPSAVCLITLNQEAKSIPLIQ